VVTRLGRTCRLLSTPEQAAAGLPLVFLIPATLALAAAAGLIIMDRTIDQKTLNPTPS